MRRYDLGPVEPHNLAEVPEGTYVRYVDAQQYRQALKDLVQALTDEPDIRMIGEFKAAEALIDRDRS